MHSREGAERHAHIQFRRDRRDRRFGSIQLYWGRTSPLEFRLRRGRRIRLNADSTYKAQSAQLFSKVVPIDQLDQLEEELRSHLVRIAIFLDRSPKRRQSFLKQEAVCHAGLMRRYGHGWIAGDPLALIDSEAQIGYRSRDRRDADDAENPGTTATESLGDDTEKTGCPWRASRRRFGAGGSEGRRRQH